ncbi:MAG: glycosyltransferase family 4 protein, partial [Bacteroidetes bacterium]|nr:glycosyltransferase family 4 protein [Bacteroidota bacterium]
AKIIFEVRDIWPLSLIEIGSFSKYHPFILLMRMVELFAIHKADFLVSNLQFYSNYLKENKIKRTATWISNAIYLEELNNTEALNPALEALLPKAKFIVGYTGKLGLSNAMSYLIEAAKLIQQEDIYFVIVGNGEEKEKLKAQAKELQNICFVDAIPKSQIPAILAKFDLCYIGWNREKLYNYGVSPNKIYDYMYAEKPILHSIHLQEELVSLAQCGLRVEEENPEAIAKGILDLYHLSPEERLVMGKKGKEFVLKNFTYSELAKRYIDLLESTN